MTNKTPEEWLEGQIENEARPDISIVVPAYNEERRLPPTLVDMIDYFDGKGVGYEIIVVDDGSKDNTTEIVHKFERIRSQVHLIRLPRNYGKGHAVKTGMLNAKGKRVLFADADGATQITEVERLNKALDEGADVAIGSRAKPSEDTVVKTHIHRRIFGRVFNFLVNHFLISGLSDTQCGFKMFTDKAAKYLFEQQKSNEFSFDIELLYLARLGGLKVEEVPVNWTNIHGSKVNLVVDSAKMFKDIFLFRIIHTSVPPFK